MSWEIWGREKPAMMLFKGRDERKLLCPISCSEKKFLSLSAHLHLSTAADVLPK